MSTDSAETTTRRVHYVLSTHWDREWHEPFQKFRYRLVMLIDRALRDIESGHLLGPFTTDGQSIIIDDYLEVRPERRAQVERLAREGKLVIGPWYVMPDEFLVSGESLVRNLRLGRQIPRDLGTEPSDAGFVCDIFGHNSQFPQILAGFGIPFAILWRGTNDIRHRNLIWRGADGTELPTFRFGFHGYCGYEYDVRRATNPVYVCDVAEAEQDLDKWIRREAEQSDVDAVLMFDGGDHLEYEDAQYELLKQRINGEAEVAGFEIVHSTLDAFGEDLVAQKDRIQLVLEGELREPARYPFHTDDQWLIPGVLSSRVWIKQENTALENLLCHWAEPFSALASEALGCDYPHGFLNVAWRWLMQNHPHDSICGCSIDLVHEDMKYRFSQTRQIAEQLTTEATRALCASVEGDIEDGTLRVAVFNPQAQPFDGITELTLQIPTDWPAFNEFFGFEPKPGFTVHDAHGHELSYQRVQQSMNRLEKRLQAERFPQAFPSHHVTVSLHLKVPALGYTTLTVKRAEPGDPTRYPNVPGLATSERSMANSVLDVTIESNGTLTVTDKRLDRTYERLLTFEDTADIGDGWYHGPPVNDQAFVSTAAAADVALVADGPKLTTFRVRTTMRVPKEFNFGGMVRGDALVDLVIDSLVSLRPGQDWVDVQTTVVNTAGDHRLRVLLPTGAQALTYLADAPFDVIERPIALRDDNHLYREMEVETKPQRTWTAVHDDAVGLAVVAEGLLETAVRDLPDRPLALTLYRSTRRTVMTNGEPGGQLWDETLTFRYRLQPLDGAPNPVTLCRQGVALGTGLKTAQLRREDLPIYRCDRSLPAEASLLRVDGPVVVTACQQVGEALEVRCFNPTGEAGEITLHFDGRPEGTPMPNTVQPVDFESNPVGDAVEVANGRAKLAIKAKQIVTVRVG